MLSSGHFWLGRPLEDLSKEELIAAILFIQVQLNEARDDHRRSLKFMSEFRDHP